jgi:hypothetical protein
MHELHALQRPDDASHALRSWHPFTPKASETLQPIGFAAAQAGLDYESEVMGAMHRAQRLCHDVLFGVMASGRAAVRRRRLCGVGAGCTRT